MERYRSLTPLEILGIAIKSEIEAQKLYRKMKQVATSEDLKEKFDFLIAQERNHEELLREAYQKQFPEVELALPPKSLVPMIEGILRGEPQLKELFEVAMKAEQIAEEFYTSLSDRTGEASSKSILLYMANMEKSHYSILNAEWRRIEALKTEDAQKFLESEGLQFLGP